MTAWTQAVEDEHRLLSQVLGVLFAFPQLPADALAGRLAETAAALRDRGQDRAGAKSDGKADFWSAVGGQYKASLDYVVTLACESGVAYERGPEVRTQTIGARLADGAARRRSSRCTASAARSPTRDGAPLADAWVALPGARAVRRHRRRRAASGSTASRAGKHKLVARAPRRRRGEGGDRRARRRCSTSTMAAAEAAEKKALTEWARAAARTAAPAPLARGRPDRRC